MYQEGLILEPSLKIRMIDSATVVFVVVFKDRVMGISEQKRRQMSSKSLPTPNLLILSISLFTEDFIVPIFMMVD